MTKRTLAAWCVVAHFNVWAAPGVPTARGAARFDESQLPAYVRRISSAQMAVFLETLAQKRPHEYREVLRDAQTRFPRGTVLESFPESVSEHLPKQRPIPLLLVKSQVEKDGFDTKAVKAVTIFKGDNGMHQVDIILVLVRDSNVVAGVYVGFWGR